MNISKDLYSLQNARPSKFYGDIACASVYNNHNMFICIRIIFDLYAYVTKQLFQVI